ncbi:MAG TPA: FAD-binding oxidoreductase [Planctomycetes bacterium]|nr:FAD-binding oxidoreductase [Planctomycetota bacterium]
MGAAPKSAHPARAFRYVEAWGMTVGAYGDVFLPRSRAELVAALQLAREDGRPLGLRGTGNSYGDASMNSRGPVLDISQMRRILDFDPETGIVEVEPGVTVRQLWRFLLPRGFWPKVVSGTSHPSMAGIAAMNIHGKNNFAVGTVGDAIVDFDLLLPNGEFLTCSREENADIFHAAIGGFGMLGIFARLRLGTKKVYSGILEVHAFANHNLAEMMEYFEEHRATSDYLVGWVDCFASGDSLGRGQIHRAHYLPEGRDPDPDTTCSLAYQDVKPNLFGIIPKSELWRPMRLINNDLGFRLLNFAKFQQSRIEAMGDPVLWTHNEFAFLLDYIPNWKWSYGRRPGRGLIQFQPFLPKESAYDTYCEILRRSQRAGFVPYLGVFKRHRPDPFLLTYAQDGWSFALDFKVTPSNKERLWRHCGELVELVLDAGGRFYFAKDLVLGPGVVERMYPEGHLERFLELKERLDPDEFLQTDLWRRVFAGVR